MSFRRLTIWPHQRDVYRPILAQMHRFRRRVFVETLGWPLHVDEHGQERDEFDDDQAGYVILLEHGEIRAAARMNPIEGACLLFDRYAWTVSEPVDRRQPAFECARFAVDLGQPTHLQRLWAARLLGSVGLAGLDAGRNHFVSLSDPTLERVLRRIGGQPRRLGAPSRDQNGFWVLPLMLPGDRHAVGRVWESAESIQKSLVAVAA